ncbi:energy transducer TonB [Flavobacteriaceae bacterium]|nr:energy transducer TonB [Flavobacteriaceae bacterium]MDC3238662.1 energy transducer TonB [Flavobacteriaceae bacterium]
MNSYLFSGIFTWRGIELRTYERDIELDILSFMDDNDEDIPITEMKMTPPPPPPPPAAPPVIDVIPDDDDKEESFIDPIEFDPDEIIPIDKVEVKDVIDNIEVPFAIIEDIPIFPGCENVSKKKQRDCFQEKMNKHIRKNFTYPEIVEEMGIQGRVYVSFIIGTDGKVVLVKPRGPDKNLEKEAQRIIENLPQMIPGKQRGKAVRVPYSIPIMFRLQ